MNNTVLGYLSGALVIVNIGFAAFAAAVPAGHALPWWALASFAALNAVVHALPGTGLIASKGN